MANGISASDSEKYSPYYDHLKKIDPLINRFTFKHDLTVISRDHKGSPERSIEWENYDGLKCLIQIYLNSDEKTFRVWLCASRDKHGKRNWKTKDKELALIPPLNEKTLEKILEESFEWLEKIEEKELEFAVNLSNYSNSVRRINT